MCFFSDTEDSAQMKIFLYQKAREAEFANQQHEQERKSGRRMCTKLLKTYYWCLNHLWAFFNKTEQNTHGDKK